MVDESIKNAAAEYLEKSSSSQMDIHTQLECVDNNYP